MFTVCPKCALTLVVTPQDLRVAQGYVRCGRCSNVFNAIVGLTDDRSALASNTAASQQSTASTTIMRKAPAIADEPPPPDPLSDTGETEAIYAEPDADEMKFQEVFADTIPPGSTARPPFSSAAPKPPVDAPEPTAQESEAISFVAPAPAETSRAGATGTSKQLPDPEQRYSDSQGVEKRYSDTEGIDTYPENELEFNPDMADLSKVFVEASPVTFKGDGTGQFEKIVLRSDENPAPQSRAPAAQVPRAPAGTTSSARPTTTSTPSPAPQKASPSAAASGRRPTATPPPRDTEDDEIGEDLRSLAARIDVASSRPALKVPPAANDEVVPTGTGRSAMRARPQPDDDEGDETAVGDIYAKAKPLPPQARTATRPAARRTAGARPIDAGDEFRTEGIAESLTPPARARGRSWMWIAGAAVLALGLVAQLIHHDRHDLATNASLNRPLTRFYEAIGVPLVPNWDLALYDVRQLGASATEGNVGTLTVRASLKNSAAQPLPLPLLRITMQDRYGNRIATRDVPPVGYVPGAVPADAHLGAGQRLDAEMTFKDPGQDAVGFEIDACLPRATGRIACANDLALAAR